MRSFLGLLSTLVLFISPLLTMGVYAEERKRGTIELLMTSPITDAEIVLGKFFASLTLYAIMILPTAILLGFMNFRSEPHLPWRMLLIGYAGILLLGGSLLSLGSLISSFTENQLIAGVLTFAVSLVIWVIDAGRTGGRLEGRSVRLSVAGPALRRLYPRRGGHFRADLLRQFYFSMHVFDGALARIDALAASLSGQSSAA